MKFLFLAFSFLTVLPVRIKEPPGRGDAGRAAAWFPLIGMLIGGITFLTWWGFRQFFPVFSAAVVATIVWIVLTGGLHLDGLADCCDGLLHPSNPERRLEIMKDPRLGSFGGIGLVLAILAKFVFLADLSPARIAWIVLAPVVGRWILLLVARLPLARPGGMGADFAAGLSWKVYFAAVVPVLFMVIVSGWPGLISTLLAHLVVWGVGRLALTKLGGVTGDVMGLSVELAELSILLVGCL
jgi:adenosylcobinamide-GDP ribazoletransferase